MSLNYVSHPTSTVLAGVFSPLAQGVARRGLLFVLLVDFQGESYHEEGAIICSTLANILLI